MNRDQHIRKLFDEAVNLAEEPRQAFLDRECAHDPELRQELESLLDADAGGDTVSPIIGEALATPRSQARVDERLGPYRVLQSIGAGGMGTVYLGERDDEVFQRKVAIKVVRGALDDGHLLERFHAERHILGRLEHPGIAGILDGGTTGDGLPYLVLEYVEGHRIDEYASHTHASLSQRLDLFLQVCDAVGFAHQNLVVHRDLKPSNIMVTAEGRVKLLDFGIAKLLDPGAAGAVVTRTGGSAMTPEYASPEQIQGAPVTTATDVHGLGILLYELLTGQHPYRDDSSSRHDVERAVLETDPVPPSRAATTGTGKRDNSLPVPHASHKLRGDLDTIVMTALRKNPGQRYASVADLAEDVRRHLRSEPILARPATFSYRAGRFLKRHVLAVTAAAVVGLTLLAATGFSLRAYRQAEAARRTAEERRDTLTEVNRFLRDIFVAADPVGTQSKEEMTAGDLLDAAAERLDTELGDRPELAGPLHLEMGRSYDHLGNHGEAEAQFRAGIAAVDAAGASGSYQGIEARLLLAETLVDAERFAAGDSAAAEAVRLATRHGEPIWIARAHQTRALALRRGGDLNIAQTELETALVAMDNAIEDEDNTEGLIANELALLYKEQGKLVEAEGAMRHALESTRVNFGDTHSKTGQAWTNLGYILNALDKPEDALDCTRRALAIYEQVFEDDHYQVAITRYHYGSGLHRLERWDDAIVEYSQALTVFENLYGPQHSYVATVANNLGLANRELGNLDDAVQWLERARDTYASVLGDEHAYTLAAMHNLAETHRSASRPEQAEALCRVTLTARNRVLDGSHMDIGRSELLLGELLTERGAMAEAREHLTRAAAILTSLPQEHALRVQAAEALAALDQAP